MDPTENAGSVTDHQEAFLSLVYDYFKQENRFPSNLYLSKKLQISDSGICNLTRRLRKNGLLEKRNGRHRLTETAFELLGVSPSDLRFPEISSGVHIPVYGEVRAGSADSDTLVTYDDDEKTIQIPQFKKTSERVVALVVTGNSMIHDGIFPGDYVLVEMVENISSLENKLIVAKFLLEEESDFADVGEISEGHLRGFTIKIYKGKIIEHGKTFFILRSLGQKPGTDIATPYEIKTRAAMSIGKVLSVHRFFSF